MSAENETIADIVKEMRGNEFDDPHLNGEGIIGARRLAKGWADRIEAAWKREQNPAPKSLAPTTCGNAAALREVLVSISSIDTRSLKRLLYELVENDIPDGGLINKIIANVNKAKAALAEPPDPIGNNAKMREALVWLQKTGHRTPEGGWMCITLKMTQKDGMPYPIEVPPYAEDVINAALSEPPRNCDRFRTRKEARDYFDDFVCLRSNGSGAIDCKGCPLDSIDSPHRADCREAWLFATATEGGAK